MRGMRERIITYRGAEGASPQEARVTGARITSRKGTKARGEEGSIRRGVEKGRATRGSGATAVLLTGIDCAERVVCHESVSFDLSEGEFVFKLGAGNGGAVLDQLLQQGALKISRVFDMGGGRPGPVCVLTPGGAPQPPFGAKSPAEVPDDDAGASDLSLIHI